MVADSKRKKLIRNDVVRRDGLDCCFCGKQLSFRTVTLEHIVPVSKRGSFNRSNLTISCEKCNSKRGDKNFFSYIENFNASDIILLKYRKLYSINLKIKVLNLAKDKCIKQSHEIPFIIIRRACRMLRIKNIDISRIECYFEMSLDDPQPRSKIKSSFEGVIKIIERLNCNDSQTTSGRTRFDC